MEGDNSVEENEQDDGGRADKSEEAHFFEAMTKEDVLAEEVNNLKASCHTFHPADSISNPNFYPGIKHFRYSRELNKSQLSPKSLKLMNEEPRVICNQIIDMYWTARGEDEKSHTR